MWKPMNVKFDNKINLDNSHLSSFYRKHYVRKTGISVFTNMLIEV